MSKRIEERRRKEIPFPFFYFFSSFIPFRGERRYRPTVVCVFVVSVPCCVSQKKEREGAEREEFCNLFPLLSSVDQIIGAAVLFLHSSSS